MPKVLSFILLGLGGYFLFQKRFRLLHLILGNSISRRFFVTALMNIPGVKSRMTNLVFAKNPSPAS
nr:hypothetical protein [uncultured Bacillus sp.]